MRTQAWIIVVVVVGIALVWIASSWVPSGDEPESATDSPSAQLNPPQPTANQQAPTADNIAPPTTQPQPQPSAPTTGSPSPKQNPTAPSDQEANSPSQPEPPPRSGPVDELKELFVREPRPSSATALESTIDASFRRPEVPAGLLKSAVCRTTVCRIETRWSVERAGGFLSAVMHLVATPTGEPTAFDPNLAISPEGDPEPDGSRAINVYLRRAGAPQTAH